MLQRLGIDPTTAGLIAFVTICAVALSYLIAALAILFKCTCNKCGETEDLTLDHVPDKALTDVTQGNNV